MILKRTEIINHKKFLFDKQNKRCALTGIVLTDVNRSHLDHDHILTGSQAGRTRGLLIAQANFLEGRIKHQFKRSGLEGKIDYIVFLKNLVGYLEKDYSTNPIHPQLIPDLKKRFQRMNLTEMKQELTKHNQSTIGTKKELTDRYNTFIKGYYNGRKI